VNGGNYRLTNFLGGVEREGGGCVLEQDKPFFEDLNNQPTFLI